MSKRPKLVCDPVKRPLRRGLEGKHVRVHLNLHNGCYVVTLGGKVQGYTQALVLADVTTKVQRSGYDRCRKDHSRNVHAYLEGTLVSHGSGHPAVHSGARQVSYNCLTHPPCFYFTGTDACFTSAARVVCLPGAQVWAVGAMNPDEPRHTVVCAWCKKVIEEGDPSLPVSHGMCAACREASKKNPGNPWNPGHPHPRLAYPLSREQVDGELLELYHRGGQSGYPQIAWTSDLTRLHEREPRRYAQVLLPGGDPAMAGRGAPRFEIAEQARWLPAPQRAGLLAHEVGHVLAPGGTELDADEAALRALGVRVGYDRRWPGKGLQVARTKRARASRRNPAEISEILGGSGEIDPSAAVILSDSERKLLEAAEHRDAPFLSGEIGKEITSRRGGQLLAGRLAPKLVGMGFLTRVTSYPSGSGRPVHRYQVTEKGRHALQLLQHREATVQQEEALSEEIRHAEQVSATPTLPPPGGPSFDTAAMEAGQVIQYEPLDAGAHVVIRVWDRSPYLDGSHVVVGEAWIRKGPGDDRSFGRPPAGYAPIEQLWLAQGFDSPERQRELYERAAALAATWGMPLSSGVERTTRDEAWWARQAQRGRASVGSYRGQGGYSAHRYFLDYPPPASLENPRAKKGEFKLRCERCGASGRFRATRCCGWHTCQRCFGEGPMDLPAGMGTPLCRWCVKHRERTRRMREGEQDS